MNQPLITVIIPIYKVEQYLRECVDSVLAQTYQNLEVYLVDDGSPDRCGEICDEYAASDSRVKVIHQENAGLSEARNSAIDVCTGEYLFFVDSDDYIDQDTIATLYQELTANDADMAVTGLQSFYENGKIVKYAAENEVRVYSKTESLDCFLFNDFLTPCVWGKLGKRALWDGVRHPKGKLFEDQYTTYRLLDCCERVVYVTTGRYHYRRRKGSIGNSTFTKRTYDLYDGIHEEYDYIHGRYATECPNIAVARIFWEIVFVNMMIRGKGHDRDAVRDVQRFARAHRKEVLACPYLSKVRKGQMLLFAYCFPVYRGMYTLYIESK